MQFTSSVFRQPAANLHCVTSQKSKGLYNFKYTHEMILSRITTFEEEDASDCDSNVRAVENLFSLSV